MRRVRRLVLMAFVVAVTGAALPTVAPAAPVPSLWLAGADGGVFTLGGAPFLGSLGAKPPASVVISVTARPSGRGYWLLTQQGQVFAFGDARSHGDVHRVRLTQPVVGIASTPTGNGYWLVASDGGVFTFGDARFHGSLGHRPLNQPISGMVPTSTGKGYWLLASDGGVFTFGDARFHGSLGGTRVPAPIAAMTALKNGTGYWLLGRDGRVTAFGAAGRFGSGTGTPATALSIVRTQSGKGYWISYDDGRVRAFGDAVGVSSGPRRLNAPAVGMATPWASSSGFARALFDFLTAIDKIRRTWAGPGEVALTFDDGPSAYTAQIVDVLQRHGVRATFFPVCATARPDLLRLEANAGMSVQVHCWGHPDLTRLSPAEISDQLRRSRDLVQSVTGRRPTCFRPPYGSTNATVVAEGKKLGLTQILWNVDPSDYRQPGAGVIASRVLAAATGRGLVVGLHDGGGDRSQTLAALPAIIEGLRARGYNFVSLC